QIVPTNYPTLIPQDVAKQVIASVTESQSAVRQLARIIPMPSGVEQVPLVTASPTSGFVSPAYGGLKPSREVALTARRLTPAEIGCVVAVPDAFVADTTFDVWGSARDEVTKSFVRVFEQAALYGTKRPDGVAGRRTDRSRAGRRRLGAGRARRPRRRDESARR